MEDLGERHSQVAEAVSVLLRTERTVRTYPIENQLSVQALASLELHLARVLPLELDVARDQLLQDGAPLMDPERDRSDLPGRLYKDGVRRIRIDGGIDADELRRFLVALATPIHPDDLSEDYVTQLWEASLPHVRISAIDPYLDLDVPDVVLEGKEVPTREVEDVGELPKEDSPVPPPPEAAFSIRPDDAQRIAEEAMAAESCPPWSNFVAALFDLLHAATRRERIEALLQLLEATFYRLIEDGRIEFAYDLLRRTQDPLPRTAELLVRQAVERMAHPDRLAPILGRLERDECSAEDAGQLLLRLGESVPESLCALLTAARGERTRRLLVDLLGKLGTVVLEPAMANLSCAAIETRGSFARVLGRIRDPRATAALLATLSSGDPRLRREVVRGLAASHDPRARARLLDVALGDEDTATRVVALRCLGEARASLDCASLVERLESPNFGGLPEEEKDLLFAALGIVSRPESVAYLAGCLRASWLGRTHRGSWRRAATALARMGTPEARAALQAGAQSRKAELAQICRGALRTCEGEG